MRRILIVTGVLGGGTALTFAAAILAANIFPNGTTVAAGWSGKGVDAGGVWQPPVVMPERVPQPDLQVVPPDEAVPADT